jgi:hypothetical protein
MALLRSSCDCGGWTDRVFTNAVLVEAVVELVDGSNDGAIGVGNEVFFVVVVMAGLVGGGEDGVNVCVLEHAWRTGGVCMRGLEHMQFIQPSRTLAFA